MTRPLSTQCAAGAHMARFAEPERREVTAWRAVGMDFDSDGEWPSTEAGQWHPEKDAALSDAEAMCASSVAYNAVFIEQRQSVHTFTRERVEVQP